VRLGFSAGIRGCEGAFAAEVPLDSADRSGMVYSRSLQATETRYNASESCLNAPDSTATVSAVAIEPGYVCDC